MIGMRGLNDIVKEWFEGQDYIQEELVALNLKGFKLGLGKGSPRRSRLSPPGGCASS
jgi:hypothetical protein